VYPIYGNGDFWWIVIGTFLIEVACCFGRFVLKKESTKDTGFIGKMTFGIRIHHGYVGLMLVFLRNSAGTGIAPWMVRIGWSCVISDLIHHFLVLWPITGSLQWDLVYPEIWRR
jgi:hypothetical protein